MMKNILFALIILTAATSLSAQEKKRIKEVGFIFYNFDGFGLTYRIGNEKSVWRFNSVFLSGGQYSSDRTNKLFGFGLNSGREWRTAITEKLDFRYGVDLFFNYRKNIYEGNYMNQDKKDESISNSGGLNIVLGFNYSISSSIIVGIEVLPYISYNDHSSYNFQEFVDHLGNPYYLKNERYSSSTSFGIQNSSALLSIIYRY